MNTHSKLPANIAILWSEQTRRVNAEEAQHKGATYTFTDACGKPKTWLKGQNAYLSPSTVSATLNRLALKYDFISDADLLVCLSNYDLLFLSGAHQIPEVGIVAIEKWLLHADKFLCVCGPTNLPARLLGLAHLEVIQPEGYTAWQWLPDSPFGDRSKWEEWYISGYKGFATCRVLPLASSTVLADQLEITGDLRDPNTSSVRALGAGIVQSAQALFIANDLFEYLGGVWQGHLNSEDVRRWFNPVNWAETLIYQLRACLWRCGQDRLWRTRLRTFGSYDGVMNIRHDPDASSDTTMLDYEGQHLIPATWTLLDAHFSPEATTVERDLGWVRAISQYEFIEAGLHNDTMQESPPKHAIGKNLAHHVIQSEKNLGIRLYSGGRHGGFSVYPEMIDAMDYLYQTVPHFLGLGTFHFHLMIAYGELTAGLIAGGRNISWVTKTSPTIAGPGFWFPLHGVVSTTEECRQVRGWDITHEYDTAPDLVDQVYTRANSKDGDPATTLPDGVYQFQYHPVFTVDPNYNHGRGTFDWMCYAVRRADRFNLWHASQKMIYERMQDYEDVAFRVDESSAKIEIYNPTARTNGELMIESWHKLGAPERSGPNALGVSSTGDDSTVIDEYRAVRCGGSYLAHIVQNRFVTVPPLASEQSCTIHLEPGAITHPFVAQANSKSMCMIDAQFDPYAEQLTMHVKVIRYQGLVVQGFAPGSAVKVVINGVARQEMKSSDGRLALFLQGPENHFVEQIIELTTASKS